MQPPLPERLNEESDYCSFGAATLTSRVKELVNQIEGAKKNDDVEYVHKLRVASRRLRAALSIFQDCFSKRQTKIWRKAVRTVTTACGAARDADVLIMFLEKYLVHADPQTAPGVQHLIMMMKTRRAVMQSDVVNVLGSLESSGILTAITDACRSILPSGGLNDVGSASPSTYENAREHIINRLDELLELEPFVHDQAAFKEHHEMRIAAKRLRYTMEIFAPLYESGLKDQIELMKQFQDVLGEMHDCYVWSHDLQTLSNIIPSEAKYGLERLLVYFGTLQKSGYRTFVYLWDSRANELFATIKEKIGTSPNSDIARNLLERQSKIGLISDIHGNVDALRAVLEDASQLGVQMFLSAGDAVGFGIYPTQVLRTLRSPRFLCVVGNVDLETIAAIHLANATGTQVTTEPGIRELSDSDVAYLQSLPRELRFELGGRNILVTHGSPFSVEEHIYPNSPEARLKEIGAKANADVIITGHTHLQMNRSLDGVIFMNPGSVGRPVNGDPKAEYAILNLDPFAVEFRSVQYDVETLADEMRKKLVPENYVQVVLRARPLGEIKKQEKALAAKRLWRKPLTLGEVRKAAKKFMRDESHAEQVRRLALAVFKKTKGLHSLGAEERYWLECAAILHEIGLSKGRKGYHKRSLGLILNDSDFPFTQKERLVIGSVVRYLRRALPNEKQFNFKRLNKREQQRVRILSSMLRIADALDESHRSVVTKMRMRRFPNRIVLECLTSGQHNVEDQSIRKRKDLFEEVFMRELMVVWKSTKPLSDPNPMVANQSSP
jgi:putative phosphoesterase